MIVFWQILQNLSVENLRTEDKNWLSSLGIFAGNIEFQKKSSGF